MKPSQLIKKAIIQEFIDYIKIFDSYEIKEIDDSMEDYDLKWDKKTVNKSNLESVWNFVSGSDPGYNIISEFREGEFETDLDVGGNRYYESKGVGSDFNGKIVGWIYWYGGGKWGESERIDWIEDAYFLQVVEEVRIVKTYSKIEGINEQV